MCPYMHVRKIAVQVSTLLIRLVHENVGLRICYSNEAAIKKKLGKEHMVVVRLQVNCMTRNTKDKMWIFSDKNLLTMDQKAKERADRLIGHCVEEVPCSYGSNISSG